MVSLKPHRPHREHRPLLAACTTSSAARIAAPVRPEPGISAEVLADLRRADVRTFDTFAVQALLRMPMHDPAEDPQPIAALLDRAEHVMRSRNLACHALFEENRARREDIAAATWIDDTLGRYTTEKTMAILDTVATAPEVTRKHAFLMQLAPIMAQLQLADRTPCGDWLAQLAETRFAADEIAEVA